MKVMNWAASMLVDGPQTPPMPLMERRSNNYDHDHDHHHDYQLVHFISLFAGAFKFNGALFVCILYL